MPRYLWATRLWGVSRIGSNCRTNAKVYEKTITGAKGLILMLSGFLNASSWSSWNILTFGGFHWRLIVSRAPSETFEKCIAQTKTCLNSWASLRFRNLSKVFLRCSSAGNWNKALSRVRHGLWSIRERWICWPFSSHIPFSIIEYPFHLEKKSEFQNAIIFL